MLVVTLSRPEVLTEYLKQNPWPFEVVGDPDLRGYRAFGLQRASWWTYLRGGVLAGYLRLIFRGWKPRQPYEGEDVHQLGGDFIVDGQRRLIYAYPSREPTDRPKVEDLLGVFRSHAAS